MTAANSQVSALVSIRIESFNDCDRCDGWTRRTYSMVTKRRRFAVAALLIAALTGFALATDFHNERLAAQDRSSEPIGFTLVAFDTTLTELEDIEAAALAAKMLLSETEQGLVMLGLYGDQAEEPQSFASAELAKRAVDETTDEMKARLGEPTESADISEMLESYASFIGQIDSAGIGRVYLLSAGRFSYEESAGVSGLESVASDLASASVTVTTVSLATTPTIDREVLAAISNAGGGTAYDLGFLDGILEFINRELGVELTPSIELDSVSATGATIDLSVAPHSSYLVAGFAFEDAETVNVIREPNGQEISESVGSVNAVSISGLKFFAVRNPQPGDWALISSSGSGPLTVYSDVVNNLSIAVNPDPPFPLGEPYLLRVGALSGELPFIDMSASIDAVVTGPDGTEETYVLNDAGVDGDVEAEDSVFSGTVNAAQVAGAFEVRLSMRWPNLQPTIEGAGSFLVEPFPDIEISTVSSDPIATGSRTHLATIDLKLTDSAFLADPDGVTVEATNQTLGVPIEIELEPAEVVDGKVYRLLVFGTVTESGDYEYDAAFDSEYLGRQFSATATSKSQTLEVVEPVPIALYAGGGVAAFVGFVFLILLLRTMFRTSPNGHLYRIDPAGEREMVADFRAYRHSAWDWLMHKPIVPAAALPAVPLHGGRFVFSSRGLSFRYRPDVDGMLRVAIGGDEIAAGDTSIADGEEFQIGSETFLFDRAAVTDEVRVSDRLAEAQRNRHEELENFAFDPMTWDAPPSARPTRRRR